MGKSVNHHSRVEKAVKKYAIKASIDDLQEVKNSLRRLLLRMSGRVYCLGHPVHQAVRINAVKLMKIIFYARDTLGEPLLHRACRFGRTEIVRMMISSCKEKGIDLNVRCYFNETALHAACDYGQTETVQMLLKNWREFGIDIKARDDYNETALQLIKHRHGEPYVQIKKMLEDEYAKIDVTEV